MDLFPQNTITGRGWEIRFGDVFESLAVMPSASIHTAVTSPPYYGQRRYSEDAREIGLEQTPEQYVAALVRVFREFRRVLRDDGTLWLNLGNTYSGTTGTSAEWPIKRKELIGVPWRVAFALQADGWYLRDEIIWSKKTPMPQSVTDRTTTAHEPIFLLSKQPNYFYDNTACRERATVTADESGEVTGGANMRSVWELGTEPMGLRMCLGCRAVYTKARFDALPGEESSLCVCGASNWLTHFAAFPSEIPARCISLGTSAKGVCPACLTPWGRVVERIKVTRDRPNDLTLRTGAEGTGNYCANTVAGVQLRTTGWKPGCECNAGEPVPATVADLFTGSGTTAMVATELGRRFVGFELNADYASLASYRANSWRTRTVEPPPVPLHGQREMFQ